MSKDDLYKNKYLNLCTKLRKNKLGYLILDTNDPKFKKEDKEYEVKYKKLIAKLKKEGWDTKEVPSKQLEDYAGMNPEIGKKMEYPHIKDNEYHIDKDMSNKIKFETLVHEVNETRDMEKGVSYWDAHTEALKDEHNIGGVK